MKKTLIWILAVAAMIAGTSPSAHADALFVTIGTGIGAVSCDNGQAFSATNCAAGVFITTANGNSIIYTGGTLNGYSITSITVTGNGPGTPTSGQIADVKSDVTNVSGTSLQVDFGSYDFLFPLGPSYALSASQTANWADSLAGDSVAFQAWVRDDNGTTIPGGTATAITPTIVSTGGDTTAVASNSADVPVSVTPPYSLTGRQTITEATGSTGGFSGSVALTAVPEPVSLVLLGAALLGTGAMGFRRRNRR